MNTKKGGYAKNKTVHRKVNKNGTFTTINYTILRDKRLKPNAKLLLIEILSDTDKFKFSETLYMNRMRIAKKTLYRAIDNLETCGYLKKTKIKNTDYNYYTISEFGNLNSNEDVNDSEDIVEETSDTPKDRHTPDLELQTRVYAYLNQFYDFVDEDVADRYNTMANEGQDYYAIKSELDKILKKNKTQHFHEVKSSIMKSYASQEVKDKAIKLLKIEVFEKNLKADPKRMRNRASLDINKRKPLDPESLHADKMSGI